MFAFLRRSTALTIVAGSFLAVGHTLAQTPALVIELEPHCIARAAEVFGESAAAGDPAASAPCTSYPVLTPDSRTAGTLKSGDALDMDLVIQNPERTPIDRVRVWLTYDPLLLEGTSLHIATNFPSHTPGETDFAPTEGYVKIDVSSAAAITDERIILANVTFRVVGSAAPTTILGTYDSSGQPTSHTAVFAAGNNILTALSPVLRVDINPEGLTPNQTASSSGTHESAGDAILTPTGTENNQAAASSSSVTNVLPNQQSMFTLLQVRNLRVTTEDHSVFLAWDLLPSTELQSYNVYYGTISGQYLQRRSIDRTSNTLTIRGLPEGIQYYFAVRGVNAKGQETEFSQEVAVTVGASRTSTSPLVGNVRQRQAPPPPKNGGTVAGNTGIASPLLLLLLGSAVIGTGLAFRRQCIATVQSSHE